MAQRLTHQVGLPICKVSVSKMTSRGHRQSAIVAEQAAEAGPPLDLTADQMHTIAAGGGRS